MPVENERKYVLSPDFDAARLTDWQAIDIRQAYLDDGPRLRQYGDTYLFTYKKWVPQAEELVEIETAISADDFNMLWPLCVESIRKTRYIKETDDGEWVVDCLRDETGAVYFVLAEVELQRFQVAPDQVPLEIADDIIHAVAANDNRFTNKKLADILYARNLLRDVSILNKKG
ncbi:hypothetical protein PQU92_09560 [Asticcacaulis sp. BYS171W]|uniref:CYTH domain-containing protein n=1 Tax=Asticcacaulis aquaticus TaxID=2984212 RepID=A0ABT5HTX6_9CAUL|nr:CYTH domain-containing protein [Asticcacaulis aquaticus]MDC7683522.1 hypothetical protein [Asticcacaulis aquaticus]